MDFHSFSYSFSLLLILSLRCYYDFFSLNCRISLVVLFVLFIVWILALIGALFLYFVCVHFCYPGYFLDEFHFNSCYFYFRLFVVLSMICTVLLSLIIIILLLFSFISILMSYISTSHVFVSLYIIS